MRNTSYLPCSGADPRQSTATTTLCRTSPLAGNVLGQRSLHGPEHCTEKLLLVKLQDEASPSYQEIKGQVTNMVK